MATKKKTKKAPAKKKTAKKAAKKTANRKPRQKKEKVAYEPNEGRIVYFMNSLIQAGYVGKTIPDDSKGKKVQSMAIRQMAQQLDRQVHKTVN
jgi:hypothetical protein